jgi:subtilisin family serine protease
MNRKISALLLVSIIFLISCSKETPLTIQPTMNEADYSTYDYSDHTDSREAVYTTVLADISEIQEGKRIIAQNELPANWSWKQFQGFSATDEIFGYDVRSCDISGENLGMVKDINNLTFDTDTTWPEVLPEGFDPKKLLGYNKNPGLGIRALHKKGITGKGVSIAIIDQGLLLEHEQYKDNIMLYERVHCSDDTAQMHGPAVASIAIGKDIGVAPKAKLYYVASTFGHFTDTGYDFDASIMADAILRVLEVNKKLDKEDKIRVISISRGYSRRDKGYEELQAAIKKADEDNVFVLTTSTNEYYQGFNLFGMDRDYEQDPEEISSYEPVYWVADEYYNHPDFYKDYLLFPIGSRTIAGCTNTDSYALSRNGGLSWGVPWCAGLYALCCQVKPEITPQEFIDAACSTSVTTEIEYNGKSYSFGKIINPEDIIKKIKNN